MVLNGWFNDWNNYVPGVDVSALQAQVDSQQALVDRTKPKDKKLPGYQATLDQLKLDLAAAEAAAGPYTILAPEYARWQAEQQYY